MHAESGRPSVGCRRSSGLVSDWLEGAKSKMHELHELRSSLGRNSTRLSVNTQSQSNIVTASPSRAESSCAEVSCTPKEKWQRTLQKTPEHIKSVPLTPEEKERLRKVIASTPQRIIGCSRSPAPPCKENTPTPVRTPCLATPYQPQAPPNTPSTPLEFSESRNPNPFAFFQSVPLKELKAPTIATANPVNPFTEGTLPKVASIPFVSAFSRAPMTPTTAAAESKAVADNLQSPTLIAEGSSTPLRVDDEGFIDVSEVDAVVYPPAAYFSPVCETLDEVITPENLLIKPPAAVEEGPERSQVALNHAKAGTLNTLTCAQLDEIMSNLSISAKGVKSKKIRAIEDYVFGLEPQMETQLCVDAFKSGALHALKVVQLDRYIDIHELEKPRLKADKIAVVEAHLRSTQS